MRRAVAMIELIFALVVMGLVLMSAPTLIGISVQSTTVALKQESINEASTRLNMILTYAWDENDTNASCIPPVLQVSQGDSELAENGNTGRRVGVPLNSNSHTFECGSKKYAASALGSDNDDADDIDDFNGQSSLIEIESTDVDYLEKTTVSIATAVDYMKDDAGYDATAISFYPSAKATANMTTNIKRITVTLTTTSTTSELQKEITLEAFSCNIGGFDYVPKVIP